MAKLMTSFELSVPCVLIDFLKQLEQNSQIRLSATTISDDDVSIEMERIHDDRIRLLLTGDRGFQSAVEQTYSCHIASVSDVTSDTNPSLPREHNVKVTKTRKQEHDVPPGGATHHSTRLQIAKRKRPTRPYHNIVSRRKQNSKHSKSTTLKKQSYKKKKGNESVEKATNGVTANSTEISKNGNSNENSNDLLSGESKQSLEGLDQISGVLEHGPLSETQGHPQTGNPGNGVFFLAARTKDRLPDSIRHKLEELAYKCPFCRYAALNVGTFKYHLRAHHNMKWQVYRSKYMMPSTARSNSSKTDIVAPVQQDWNPGTSLREFHRRRSRELRRRKPYDRSKDHKNFVCELCGLKYKTKGSLVSHLHSKHSDHAQVQHLLNELRKGSEGRKSALQMECPFCRETFSGQRVFTHMKVTHIDEKDFTAVYKVTERRYYKQVYDRNRDRYLSESSCPHCGSELKKSSLKRHIENHCKKNALRRHRYHCHLCSYFSADKAELDEHKATSHAERPEYVCEMCGVCYQTTVGLRQHARIKHQVVWRKPLQWWTCENCNKSFPSRLSLERHKPVHTKEYRHPCTLCDKKFKDTSSLSTHHRNIHKGQYRYTCQYCGHGMERKSYLERHRCDRTRRQSKALEAGQPQREISTASIRPLEDDQDQILVSELEFQENNSHHRDGEQDSGLQQTKEDGLNGVCSEQSLNPSSEQVKVKAGDGDEQVVKDSGTKWSGEEVLQVENFTSQSTDVIRSCEEAGEDNVKVIAEPHRQQQSDITYIVHGTNQQVTAAIGVLSGLQIEDSSVIVMETDLASSDLMPAGSVAEQHVITVNTTLSDCSTLILLPNQGQNQDQSEVMPKHVTD